ncbi:NADH2 dehydrogenase family protein [Hibiscus syriacus]|uniref:NADH2 dehydrogenase family protein n=1 Tax=Hibiscus syriacus TaxID=106335 RepID=A0A6A3BWE9_HIBSY|nr:zinc finger protein CONSTANS-LIKE 16-like [Hibiscus syriacus]KAE8721073.1 NADH2 dehydrogenase family protein [Hibiscus syriacus]
MITDKKAANTVGGKTARPCDGCLQKRARWYCAADDAFLCQGCDTSVHSANLLASRHERVRLETASSRGTINRDVAPAWHRGFARKSRTPRQNKATSGQQKGDEGKVLVWNPIDPLVPEVGSEEGSVEENDEQLLCRVPVFDSFSGELCNMVPSDCDEVGMLNGDGDLVVEGHEHDRTCELDDGLHSFLASDLDLAEFAADVERLLGVGPDEDSSDIKIMKVKEEGTTPCFIESAFEVGRASLNSNFDYEDEPKAIPATESMTTNRASEADTSKRNKLLRLNYESVINAWTIQRSPWTTGTRPELNPDDFMLNGDIGGTYRPARGNNTDGEREAKVSRYREKRRTRLFSKKIRYEVRKLNAEKRPRMKGRFVKRTCFCGTGD